MKKEEGDSDDPLHAACCMRLGGHEKKRRKEIDGHESQGFFFLFSCTLHSCNMLHACMLLRSYC
jgi:hypothetical protein